MLAASRNELPFECFKMEAQNFLTELNDLHIIRKRQIDRIFNVLFDNMPSELKDMPINETMEKLLTLLRKKLSDISDNLAIDDTINDADFIDGEQSEKITTNLTSTVKKINPIKSSTKAMENWAPIIDEQSIITSQSDSYCVGLYYYLKDGTRVETKLKDLKEVDLQNIHENCAEDIKEICDFYVCKNDKTTCD